MSYNEQAQVLVRQTSLDVYTDAAKILEQLLEKRTKENLRVPDKSCRNQLNPNSAKLRISKQISNRTCSIRVSKSLDEALEINEKTYLQSKFEEDNPTTLNRGSESSIETDNKHLQEVEQRRKKSLFKRAKERLRHAFNHHQSQKINRIINKNNDHSSTYTKDETQQQDNHNSHPERSIETGEESSVVDERFHKKSVKSSEPLVLIKKNNFRLISFKKLKKLNPAETTSGNNDKKEHKIDNNKSSRKKTDKENNVPGKELPSSQKSTTFPGKILPPKPTCNHKSVTVSDNAPPPPSQLTPNHGNHWLYTDSLPPPSHPTIASPQEQNIQPKSPQTPSLSLHGPSLYQSTSPLNPRNPSPQHLSQSSHSRSPSLSIKSFDLAQSNNQGKKDTASPSCSRILHPDQTSDGSTQSGRKNNVLDNPGEEIVYMDDDNNKMLVNNNIDNGGGGSNEKVVSAADVEFYGDKKLLGSKDMDQTPGVVHPVNITDKDNKSESRTGSNIVPGSSLECLYDLAVDSHNLDSRKEVLYGKIAEKLIELSDGYVTSDHEVKGADAALPVSLSELEREIISCLRSGGDRYSKQMDETIEEVTQQTTQEAYQRFQSTVQNSMGSDLSWDHLAFLFYTTKGVVSAVGSGSRRAHRVKEFTLQYISDTFASWIMDQGGFGSVLSGEESDFDVD